MFSACTFKSPIEWTGGNLSVTDCDFDFEGQHLSIGPDVKNVIIADSRFKGKRNIVNKAGDKVLISEPGKKYIKPPAYRYAVNKISTYAPPRSETAFVKAGNGKNEDAARLQNIIDSMSEKGGGYVVLSPGLYLLNSSLRIKENVELRGQMQSWQHSKFLSYYVEKDSTKGVIIYVNYGKDLVDSTLIILEENAGLDGLFFHYPDQEFNGNTKEVMRKFSWLIRMKGDRSYVKHVTASNPWRFIDSYTYDPKDIYIGYCNGAPLEQGIRIGEAENCMIDNVHFNSWYWNTVYFPNTIKKTEPQQGYKKELDNWMKANSSAFIFAGSRNVDVYGCFAFCTKSGFTLLPGKNSGIGPSGIIINSGCDWSKFGLFMHANNSLVFANMHFIDVGENDPDLNISSIYVAADCNDEINLYNLSTWGTSHRAFALLGGSNSRVNIYNFSYQLYFPQINDISKGNVQIINAIRNVPKHSITFNLGTEAYFGLRSSIFPTKLTVSPTSVKKNLEDMSAYFYNDCGRGVIRSYSFL